MIGTGAEQYWKWSGLGFEFVASVGLFLYLGYLADERWATQPWGMIVGVVVGFAGGLYLLIRAGFQMMRELDTSDSATARDKRNAAEGKP